MADDPKTLKEEALRILRDNARKSGALIPIDDEPEARSMTTDPYAVAQKVRQMCQNEPGFLDCTVELPGPPLILAYLFTDGPSAEAYRQKVETITTQAPYFFQYQIANNNPHVLLEKRP